MIRIGGDKFLIVLNHADAASCKTATAVMLRARIFCTKKEEQTDKNGLFLFLYAQDSRDCG